MLFGFGLLFTIVGAATLYRGGLGWSNYWGGFVFAPFAIVIGVLAIIAAFKKPSALKRKRRDRSGFAWGKGQK